MKIRYLTLSLLGGLTFLTGCETVNDRIKEKPAAFAQADAAAQGKIKQGIIDLGFTEDQVYVALGKPDQKRESVSPTGKTITWIYNTYYVRSEGTQLAGYSRHVYFDPYLKSYRVDARPVYTEVYTDASEERIRMVFKEGKVAVIEQSKD